MPAGVLDPAAVGMLLRKADAGPFAPLRLLAGFKEISESEGHTPPESKRGKDLEDTLLERSFWSRWVC
jgi:hypothetical protein